MDTTAMVSDSHFMAEALKLAAKGEMTTTPNPNVGCVIVNNGEIVGQGYHRMAGEAHAEVVALSQAGDRAIGSTLYVTLEPCRHQGRTGPCCEAIIKAKVARVVVAMHDPNPLVNMGGIETLEAAGIKVTLGVGREQAMEMNRGFVKRVTTNRPFVIAKTAISVDGRTAMANGESQWITSEPARKDAQRLRAVSSAIVTGIGTVLRDNPSMNVRLTHTMRQPLRVILDTHLNTPVDAKILKSPGRVLIVTAENDPHHELNKLEQVEMLACPMKHGEMDLAALVDELGRKQMNTIMIEAGARLGGNFIRQGLVDELVIYMAPDLLGSDAKDMFKLTHLVNISDKIRCEYKDVRMVGRDLKLTLSLTTQ